jgi:hypothetical protein
MRLTAPRLTGGDGGTVRIRDMLVDRQLRQLTGHTDRIDAVAPRAHGVTLA